MYPADTLRETLRETNEETFDETLEETSKETLCKVLKGTFGSTPKKLPVSLSIYKQDLIIPLTIFSFSKALQSIVSFCCFNRKD